MKGLYNIPDPRNPSILFAYGLAIVFLSLLVSFGEDYYTFIHMWKVELLGSLLLIGSLGYIMLRRREPVVIAVSKLEIRLIVLPLLAMVLLSAASALWAPSWKSAVHHSLVWSQYLIFYIVIRQIVKSDRNYIALLTILSAPFVIYAVPAVVEYCAHLVLGGATALGIRYAKYGEQINTITPLVIAALLPLKGRRFVFGIGGLVMMWLLIFCSLGRINIILFTLATVSFAAVVFAFRRFHIYRTRIAIIVLTLILAPFPLHLFSLFAENPNIPMVKRVSDEAGISASNNLRKLMTSLSLEMFRAHPVGGIGADNFGFEVNNYRASYAGRSPQDPNLASAENEISERAHNEYLQILAELGIVGAAIFGWLLAGIALMAYRAAVRRPVSLTGIAAVLGLGMFLASSLVSSYSFRLIQNGFVFFFVLAVASKHFMKPEAEDARGFVEISPRVLNYGLAAGIAACLMLGAYSVVRVSSVIITTNANYVEDLDEALPVYEQAIAIDDENPDAHSSAAYRLLRAGRYDEATAHYRESINIGKGTSTEFSHLTTAQLLGGDGSGAEATLAEAALLYPRSPFVLTRYAVVLKENGKEAESRSQFDRALQINKRAANTWWTYITEGARAASEKANFDENYSAIMDVQPQSAIYAIGLERELKNPSEQIKMPGM